MKLFSAFATTSIMAVLVGCAGMASAEAPVKTADGTLTNAAGMTLYTFDKDPTGGGKSACNGPCATNWPPLLAQDGEHASGKYSIVKRDDGTQQWAYMGKPLYLWMKDKKPGDKTGDGVKNVWHAAKP